MTSALPQTPVTLQPVSGSHQDWRGTYLSFRFEGASPSGRTHLWGVWAGPIRLGAIRWFARWRKYAFFPQPETVFESICLAELTQFLRERQVEHRKGLTHD